MPSGSNARLQADLKPLNSLVRFEGVMVNCFSTGCSEQTDLCDVRDGRTYRLPRSQ